MSFTTQSLLELRLYLQAISCTYFSRTYVFLGFGLEHIFTSHQ